MNDVYAVRIAADEVTGKFGSPYFAFADFLITRPLVGQLDRLPFIRPTYIEILFIKDCLDNDRTRFVSLIEDNFQRLSSAKNYARHDIATHAPACALLLQEMLHLLDRLRARHNAYGYALPDADPKESVQHKSCNHTDDQVRCDKRLNRLGQLGIEVRYDIAA